MADFELVRPVLHIDRNHLEAEKRDDVPAKDHGWQDALQAIYPLKINTFEIHDGEVTYVEAGRSQPHLSKITVVAHDIRNVRADTGEYPSPVRVEAVVFDRGRALIEGHADVLADPHVGALARDAPRIVQRAVRTRSLMLRQASSSRATVISLMPSVRAGA